MDENNQVLDVTYGNFSCRLEGFDDSVETMKVVVSFFHDLAGHDRFMDTEPLAPDMETLARLTEEQTGQPVEAEGYDNKVSLRVRTEVLEDDLTTEDNTAAEDIPEPLEEPANEALVDAPVVEEEAESIADDLSSVADKLQRMRAAAATKVPTVSDDYAEDVTEASTAPTANPLSQRLSELVQRTNQPEADSDEDADIAEEAEFVSDDAAEPDEAEVIAEEHAPEEDALDADEMNVFSDLTSDTDEDHADDEAASDDTFVLHDPVEEPVADEDDDADMTASEPEIVDTADDEDAIADTSEDDLAETEDTAAEDAELDAFLAEEDAAQEEEIAELDDVAEVEDVSASESDETVDDVDHDDERVQTEPLVLTAADEAVADPQEEHDDYNDDDEFNLEEEVAKVEAEIAARKGNEFAKRGLPRHVEDAMSRIMSQTDQHLNQPENRRHRDAFAQLKAAVAATEAARQLGDNGAEKRDPDEVYKDDLGAHGDKDKGERNLSTPLKLVKSQEVKPEEDISDEDGSASDDAPAEENNQTAPASARLRQIATKKEAETIEEGNDFAAFLASHGVTDLADQLEAAGAYICFVEGDADFSRPQVMKLLQSASSAEISREDGLRSFGRLLRQGRLLKLANGRFQVSENTQYRPDDSKVAQG